MKQMAHVFWPGAILLSLIVMVFVAVAIFRGLRIPQCQTCGAAKVRPSRGLGLLDAIGSLLLIQTYRCSGCLVRFHAIRLPGRPRPAKVALRAPQPANLGQVVSVDSE